MKKVQYSKRFRKNYKKRFSNKPNVAKKFKTHLDLFIEGKRDAPINDQPLKGEMHGYRSFSVGGDISVIYIEDDEAYTFMDIGSHNQVYK